MRTALDTSVILDVITDDPDWGDASEAALLGAYRLGALVIGECVLAEIVPALKSNDLNAFLREWRIQYLPTSQSAAIRAGRMFECYLRRSNQQKRVLPDFLIGAHALEHCKRLLARDRGYYRDYFEGLDLTEPTVQA